jgi:uncharacterized RDD family membrane protein YckC
MDGTAYTVKFTDAIRPERGASRVGTVLHRHEVMLPEGVRASFEVANPIARLLALMLDIAIVFTLLFALYMAMGFVLIPMLVTGQDTLVLLLFAVATIAGFLLGVGYFFLFEVFFGGRTPGKMTVGMRVVGENGAELTPRQGLTRSFMRMAILGPVPAFIVIGGFAPEYLLLIAPLSLLGFVMFIDRKCRGIPDFVSGTYVVRATVPSLGSNRPYVPPYFQLPHHHFPLSHSELSRLTPDDYVRLEEFGARLATIHSRARQQAAMAAAAALAKRMEYSHTITPQYAELFLFEMHSAIKQQLQQLYPDLYE